MFYSKSDKTNFFQSLTRCTFFNSKSETLYVFLFKVLGVVFFSVQNLTRIFSIQSLMRCIFSIKNLTPCKIFYSKRAFQVVFFRFLLNNSPSGTNIKEQLNGE